MPSRRQPDPATDRLATLTPSLRALAERGVPILNFQPIQASLEGAFWRLAKSAKSRAA